MNNIDKWIIEVDTEKRELTVELTTNDATGAKMVLKLNDPIQQAVVIILSDLMAEFTRRRLASIAMMQD